jgi:predicted DCC family thiol-disulfide oxidoreductase YuxK
MDRTIVLYDEDCGFCRWCAERLRDWDRSGSLRFVPLHGNEADTLLSAMPLELQAASWHVVEPDGRVWSAGAAVPRVLRRLPAGSPIAVLAEAMPELTDRAYEAVARRRGELGRLLGRRACGVDPSRGAETPPDRTTREA